MNSIFEYVAISATQNPDKSALCIDEKLFSYDQLSRAAEHIADILSNSGMEKGGNMVGLAADPTFETFAGLLGILASGNTYVPLNLQWNDSRILDVCKRAKVSALIFDKSVAIRFQSIWSATLNNSELVKITKNNLFIVFLDNEIKEQRRQEQTKSLIDSYAYLIFTSGSTGLPKGVAVTHKNVIACLEGVSSRYPLEKEDNCVLMADLSFDFSVAEMFMCWKAGACLHIPTKAQRLNPSIFINNNQISIWSSVPSSIRIMRDLGKIKKGYYPRLRLSLFCGESLSSRLADQWQQCANESMIVNLYGPTEATIFATDFYWKKSMSVGQMIPIGKNLPNVSSRVDFVSESEGVGEMLLSGPQVVGGYWDDPIATNNSFIRDDHGKVWYRTGDLVQVDKKHGFIFRGRFDSQVKCRGFRLDLEEVRGVVANISSSDLVVVIPVKDQDGLCECLVAFCDSPILVEAALRILCSKELPNYMIPRRIISMLNFPLTENGKVDRQQLEIIAMEAVRSKKT